MGLCPEQLSGILLTHEHGDHTSALKVILIASPSADILQFPHRTTFRISAWCTATGDSFTPDRSFGLEALPSGRSLFRTTLSIRSDFEFPATGRASECLRTSVMQPVSYSRRYVEFARCSSRQTTTKLFCRTTFAGPGRLKQRILSRHGHLSNTAAARVLAELDAPLEHIILGHLSRDCNSPNLALDSAGKALPIGENCFEPPSLRLQDTPGPVLRII